MRPFVGGDNYKHERSPTARTVRRSPEEEPGRAGVRHLPHALVYGSTAWSTLEYQNAFESASISAGR
jgi:hypothetical protein